ncbi:tetratricopeptide repeat protein [Amphibacillus sediminis]|uniref:tetratricopeptide repeat protein n=1 Tax=Amphibacillus sediminis TaxID=360185 RepID=UPI0008336AB1|nr:hypothetical protein [Amphibacillus sediminis]
MQCKLKSHNEVISLTVSRLFLYHQCKLVLAQDYEGSKYFLVFHKDQFIHALKLDKLKPHHFLDRARRAGLSIPGNQPVIRALLNQKTFNHLSINQLKHKFKLHQGNPNIDQVIIQSYFDQVLPTNDIVHAFKQCFLAYRRNGNMQKAYQVLLALKVYQPDNSFAKDMLTSVDFQRYHHDYTDPNQLKFIDPYFYEQQCYHPLNIDQLSHFLKEQNRQIDLAILATYRLTTTFSSDSWEIYQSFLNLCPSNQQLIALAQLLKLNPSLLQHDIFAKAILARSSADQYVKIVTRRQYPHPIDNEAFVEAIAQASPTTKRALLAKQERLIAITKSLSAHDIEQIIKPILASALESESMDSLMDWLEPFDQQSLLKLHHILAKIKQLKDDPDHQLELADLYLSFNQLEPAINCLKWELELNPANEKALKQLITLLKQDNKNHEADAYQEQLIQLTKYH